MQKGLIIAGFAFLSVLALTGWTRKVEVAPNQFNAGTPGGYMAPAAYPAYPGYAPGYAPMGYYNALVYPGQQPMPVAPVMQQPGYYPQPTRVERVVQRRYVPVTRNSVTRRKRPLSHSVAIIGGTAGAGAAIGALAGGGKGAGIGALAGGLGGFLYDHLTRNK